jgi:hypothetical protein
MHILFQHFKAERLLYVLTALTLKTRHFAHSECVHVYYKII